MSNDHLDYPFRSILEKGMNAVWQAADDEKKNMIRELRLIRGMLNDNDVDAAIAHIDMVIEFLDEPQE